MLPGWSAAVPALSLPDQAIVPPGRSAWTAPVSVDTMNGVETELVTSGVLGAPSSAALRQYGSSAAFCDRHVSVAFRSGTRMLPSARIANPLEGREVFASCSGSASVASMRYSRPWAPRPVGTKREESSATDSTPDQ